MRGTWILFAGLWGCVLRICLDEAEENEGKKQGPAMPEAGGAVTLDRPHSHTWTGAFGFKFSVFCLL